MIVRIVRMSFEPGLVNSFLTIFNDSKEAIRNFEGCRYLSLNQDHQLSNVYFTISHWDNIENLASYRDSVLFKTTWARVKPMFNERPQAYTLKKEIELG